MKSIIKNFLREPITQFLLIGLVIFFLSYYIDSQDIRKGRSISITDSEVQRLRGNYLRQWGHAPDNTEMKSIINDAIRDEVLYREALKRGLDEEDLIVKRRLIQKMEFLMASSVASPNDAQLRNYYAGHLGEFLVPTQVSFEQVFFSKQLRANHARQDAEQALDELKRGIKVSGDFIEMQNPAIDMPLDSVASNLGESFVKAISKMNTGAWSGPFESVYGYHLIRLTKRSEAHTMPFESVKDKLIQKVTRLSLQTQQRDNTQELISQYTVHLPKSLTGYDKLTK